MGLDMYLERRTYVKKWPHTPEERKTHVSVSGNMQGIKQERISYIIEEVAYWRKANAIHSFFVDSCADGRDECQPIYISEDAANDLLERINTILNADPADVESEADRLLPTKSGFFFGGTEYDEYYLEQLRYTKGVVEGMIEDMGAPHYGQYYYQASW